MTRFWCESAWLDGAVTSGVLLTADETGTLTSVDTGVAEAPADAEVIRGLTLPGGVNAHSHAFPSHPARTHPRRRRHLLDVARGHVFRGRAPEPGELRDRRPRRLRGDARRRLHLGG